MHLLYLYIGSIASARARNWTIVVVVRCRFLGGSKLNLQRPSSPSAPFTAVFQTVFSCVFSPRANTIIVVTAPPRKTAAPAMYSHTHTHLHPRPLT